MKDLREMKIHIIGIGGTGMAPIAVVLHEMGVSVTGSDRDESGYTMDLRSRGVQVTVPQKAENIQDPDLVFYSSAIHDDNPELAEARRREIPTLKRREFLNLLLNERKTIAFAGSHGKSTTTAMAAWVFTQLGLEPGFIVGSSMKDMARNAAAGKSEWFIIEADEYDNMFLGLYPYISALTRVEYDHPDCFPTLDIYLNAFCNFLAQTKDDGMIFLNGDDAEQEMIILPENRKSCRYGFGQCDFRALQPEVSKNGCYSFIFTDGINSVPVHLQIPGKFNVSNAMLVLSICAANGMDMNKAAEALSSFHGIKRRFEQVGEWNGITLIDDYAHHPTEIASTLKAAREYFSDRRIWAIWQPHTYSRTQALLHEFCSSFSDADEVIITDIFASREKYAGFGIENVLSEMKHNSVHFQKSIEDVVLFLEKELRPGDVVVTLSAGDANKAAPLALEGLKNAAH